MSTLAPLFRDLRRSLGAVNRTGVAETGIPGVRFFWNEDPVPRAPLLYDAGLVIVGHGGKVGYLAGRRIEYGADTCLVLGVPVPFECEVLATPDEPLLGLRLDIDRLTLHRLAESLGDRGASETGLGVAATPVEGELHAATARLLRTIADPIDRAVVGPSAVEEVVYRVLRSPQGSLLFALTEQRSAYASVAVALERIHRDYAEPMAVPELAQASGMSTSAFHRAFKSVTGESPLQYVKKVRLLKAKARLVFDGARVDEAAFSVGYASASQFSREFKRYFNVAPSHAATLPYSDPG